MDSTCRLSSDRCLLFVSSLYCELYTVYCMMFTARFLLSAACYLLSTVNCLIAAFLFTTRHLLSIASITYPPWIHQSIVNFRSFNVYESTVCWHYFMFSFSVRGTVPLVISWLPFKCLQMSTAYFSLFFLHFIPCCGAVARAEAEESKLMCLPEPEPEPEPKITNWGFASFLFTTDLKEFLWGKNLG